MKMLRCPRLFAGLATASLLALTACGSTSSSPAEAEATATSLADSAPTSLDPAPSTTISADAPATTAQSTAPPTTPAASPTTTDSTPSAPLSTDTAPADPSAPSAPVFDVFEVSAVTPCADGGDPSQQVTVTWSAAGADSVYVAIDNEFGPFEQNLAASGSLVVPGPGCTEPNVYYVVAENGIGRTVKSATRTGS